ncbi:hypothetical protein Acsp03_14410 [Actinomadura sp. NBRC 104412]|uniref:hypothetical protein n=1 Tax=Actinomadura sp. NBRC 104412 TaxID=3032203 RepID=UPI00249FFFEC|nr:hypothetical protein [Actinomadura sp. NBRC 104412]GLZ03975.1 hypothetical protein Acsp03_14410 [Actinomadura sp. NBRC 104412]
MALIALAADKGAPGVTTAAVALGAVWPRPVLVAECDQAGGDLVYRLPAAASAAPGTAQDASREGGMLNPSRGLLSLAATARRGLRPEQIAEHCQRLVGGLDVLVGITNAEQAQGMTWLWGPLGRAFASLAPVDVLADCGRLGAGTPLNDLLREADLIVLFTRATLEQVAHLRERVAALSSELNGGPPIGIVVLADPRDFRSSIAEVGRIITGARVLGGLALDPKGAELLSGRWGGRLDRSLLIRSAREVAATLVSGLTPVQELQPVQQPVQPVPQAQALPAQVPPVQAPPGQASQVQAPPTQVPQTVHDPSLWYAQAAQPQQAQAPDQQSQPPAQVNGPSGKHHAPARPYQEQGPQYQEGRR